MNFSEDKEEVLDDNTGNSDIIDDKDILGNLFPEVVQ